MLTFNKSLKKKPIDYKDLTIKSLKKKPIEDKDLTTK